VCKDQLGAGLASQPLQVLAVPSWEGRSEDAWFGTEPGICIESHAEAISVYRTTTILFFEVMMRSGRLSNIPKMKSKKKKREKAIGG